MHPETTSSSGDLRSVPIMNSDQNLGRLPRFHKGRAKDLMRRADREDRRTADLSRMIRSIQYKKGRAKADHSTGRKTCIRQNHLTALLFFGIDLGTVPSVNLFT